ncbi:MAG: hypothetical protein ACI4AK_05820 [Lepagella sp.]
MKYPDKYKDREALIASLTNEVIEELDYKGVLIKNWNDEDGFNRIIIDNDDWCIELDIFVDGYVESSSGDYYTPPESWLKRVEADAEGSIYLIDGEEVYEIEESLVSNLLYDVERYIEENYAEG